MDFVKGLAVLRLAVAAAAPPIGRAQERDIKPTLDFIALGRHAPWYVAVAKGYFKDEELNVTIIPSKGTADAIRAVRPALEFGFSTFRASRRRRGRRRGQSWR